jgi:hypothetical protein
LKQTLILQNHTNGGSNDALSSIVRYRFRRDRKLISPSQVGNGLNAGYAMLDLVHACNNKDSEALKKLVEMLESTTAQAEATAAWRSTLVNAQKPPSPRRMPKIEHLEAVANKANQVRHPESKPILERPLPLSEIRGGNRRVPNLVTAHGMPFLRYSKPQPVSLSRVIRQRLEWNDKNWAQRGVVETQILMAEFEDKWDELLRREHGIVVGDAKTLFAAETSWTDEFRNTDAAILKAIRVKDAKYVETGEKMWEIVKKEKELKRQEKIERRIARKAMRAASQEASEGARPQIEHADRGALWTSSGAGDGLAGGLKSA